MANIFFIKPSNLSCHKHFYGCNFYCHVKSNFGKLQCYSAVNRLFLAVAYILEATFTQNVKKDFSEIKKSLVTLEFVHIRSLYLWTVSVSLFPVSLVSSKLFKTKMNTETKKTKKEMANTFSSNPQTYHVINTFTAVIFTVM